MRKNILSLIFILAVTVAAVLIDLPQGPKVFGKELKANLGLDLQGGIQLEYEIDTSKLQNNTPEQAQEQSVDLIRRRIEDLRVSEPNVQPIKIGQNFGVLVELPGIHDLEQAKSVIGKTAQLKFYELGSDNSPVETNLTGSDVKKATAGTDNNSSSFSSTSPVIYLEFTTDGAIKFKEITKRNVGKTIITMLDDQVINQATVQTEIDGGKAQIEGISTLKEAKDTAKLINEGALPAPISLVSESHVGATLGQDAIDKSLIAGIIGLILVAIFMIIYYRGLGLVATTSLVIYSLIVIAIFKLINVTLTLSGIAGFIFSIGVAADANILIFERFKEELRKGIPTSQALQNGFDRSWPSIRDSNMASIITALVLYEFATGTVKGFAVTLMIGIFVSLFTSITVTRNILRFTVKEARNK